MYIRVNESIIRLLYETKETNEYEWVCIHEQQL